MQLELFARASKESAPDPIWEQLSREEQKTLISALAELMKKSVRPVDEERRSPDEQQD